MSDLARPLVRPLFLKWSIVISVLLVPFVFISGWDYLESKRFARNVALVEEAGEPLTVFEADRFREPNGDAAAAARYYRAAAALARPTYQYRPSSTKAFQSTPSPSASEALMYIDRAALLPFHSFESGTNYSYLSSELTIVGGLARERTRAAAERGDSAGASSSLYSELRLQRALEQSAGILGVLPRVVQDLELVLSHVHLDSQSLNRLASAFAAADRDDTLKRVLLRERAGWLEGNRQGRLAMRGTSWFTRPYMLYLVNNRLDHLRALIDHAKLPWPRRLDLPPVTRDAGALTNDASIYASDETRVRLAAFAAARLHAGRIAIAAVQYRDKSGAWPPSVSALVPEFLPEVPVDPYRGEPMRSLIEDDGSYVAYSVGLNNRDERGKLADALSGAVRPGQSRAMAEGDVGVRISIH